MKKLIVLAMAVVLSLSLVWAADSVNGTKKMTLKIKPSNNIQKVEPNLKGLPNGSPQALESASPKQTEVATVIDPGANREGTETLAPAAKPSAETAPGEPGYLGLGYDKEAAAKEEALRNSKTLLEFLQEAGDDIEQPVVNQFGDNGTQPPIIATTLLSQTFHAPGWSLDDPSPLGVGWAILDSGTEGQQTWYVDDWHKFFFSTMNDTVLASGWSTNAYSESTLIDWLITPAFDLTGAVTCSLYLKEYYDNVNTVSDSANVMVTIDDGTNWTRVRQFKADSTTVRTRGIDLSAFVNNPAVKVGFLHCRLVPTTASNGWVVDSIRVSIDGVTPWVQDVSGQMSGWFGNTPPAGPGGAWTIQDLGNVSRPKATNSNDWNRRFSSPGNLGNDTVAACTYTSSVNRREFENEWIITPMFSIGASVACTLSMNEYWNNDATFFLGTVTANEHGYIKISETTDGGTTWEPWQIIADHSATVLGSSNSTPVYVGKYPLNTWRGKDVRLGFQKVAPPEMSFCTWYMSHLLVEDYALVTDDIVAASVGVTSRPLGTGITYPLSGTFINNGSASQTYDARIRINDGTTDVYDQTVTGVTTGSLESSIVTFPNFTLSSAVSHTFTLYVINPGDENTLNDSLVVSRTVYLHEGTGGPDAGYYSWIDNTQFGGPTFSWVDMTGATPVTFVGTFDDSYSNPVYMGSSFFFYAAMKDSITFGTNGYVTFDRLSASPPYLTNIPDAGLPQNFIGFMRSDMYCRAGGTTYLNDVANNRFVIQYDSIYFYNTPSQSFDCQVILDRDDSTVTIQYNNFGPTSQTDAVIGIENGAGTIGLEYYYNATLLGGLGNYPFDGLAIKFFFTAPAADVGIASIDGPNGFLFIGTPYTISATAQNFTSNPAVCDVEFYADAVLVGTLLGVNIGPGGTTPVSSPNTWTPASTGIHTISAKTIMAGDTGPGNDQLTVNRSVVGALVAPPFSTDFEADNGGFVVGAGEWEWGIPTEAIGPPSAHSPVNLWGVDLDNTYDPSTLNTLYSVPLDLTGLAAPTVKFWMWLNVETNYDGANVKASSDYGATWTVLTTSLPYQDVGDAGVPGIAGEPIWEGAIPWTEITVNLAAYAGQTVILRFDQSAESSVQYAGMYIDDFSFYEPPANDVGVSTILAPGSITIQGFSWAVRSRVHNFGTTMQLNVPVTFEIRDILYNLVYTDSRTLTQIEPGADSTVEFTAWSPAEPDTHRITTYTANPGDANVANDTAHATTYTYTHVGNGGPVANYTFADNVNGGGPAFSWIDITGVGTPITTFASPDDGNSGFIPMGMTFKYFGTDYTQIAACTNGWLSFVDAASTNYINGAIPDGTTPNGLVGLLWDDMHLGTGTVYYFFDSAENRFIVEYYNTEFYPSGGPDCIQMEAIFDADDNSIKFQYNTFCTGSETDVTVGIESPANDVALAYDNNGEIGQTPLAGVAVTFTYTPPPIPDYTVSALGVPTDVFAAHGRVGVHGYYSATVSDLNSFGGTADVTLNIFDPFLMLVHTETVTGVSVPSSGDIVVPFPTGYTPAVNGAFTLEAIVSSPDDPNPANDLFTRPMDVSPTQDAYYYDPDNGFSAYNAASGWIFAQMYTALADGYITNADIYLGAFTTGGDVHFYYWPIVDGVPDLANPLLDMGTLTIPPGFWIVSLDLTGSEIPVSTWDSVAVGFQNDPINPCDVSGVFETPGQGYEVYRDFINVGGTWFDNQANSNYGWDMYFEYLNPTNPEVATVPTSFSEILPVNSIGNFGFTLFNLGATGTPDLNWSASSGDGWIQNITPAAGTLPALSNTAVTFDINTAGLIPYTNYSGSIVITSNDPLSPYTLPVSLYTATTPALGLAESGNFTLIAVSNHGVLGDSVAYGINTYNWGGTGRSNYGGTFILGNSGSSLLLEYGTGIGNNPYRATEPLDVTDTFHPTGAFDDGGTLYGGLSVAYSGEGFHTGVTLADSGDFFFHKYVITNNTGAPINGLFTGLYFDWDIGGTDFVTFDRSRNLIIQNKAGGPYFGLSLLSGDVNTLMGVSQDSFIYDQQGWIAETLFAYMNKNADLLPAAYPDMGSMLSFGPFDLGVGESIPVAFAVIGGATAQDIADGADMAFSIYTGAQPCVYIPGDINGTGIINGVQVSYAVNYFKGFGPPPPFICPDCPIAGQDLFATGDVNGTCEFNGVDIQYYINYFKVAGPDPTFCPACPPGGAAPAVVKPGLKVKATKVGGAE